MKISPDPLFTPEQEVLLWTIRVDHTKDQRIGEILGLGVDWEYIRETAIQHGIIPLLYKRLKGEMAYLVPSDELSTFRTLFMANAIKNIRMEQHLLKTLDILADSAVEAMPFKGPALAVQAYGDLSMRSFYDLDILIHDADQSKVYQILTSQGYILTGPGWMSIERRLGILDRKDLKFSTLNGILELHWKIIERLYAVSLDMDQIWDRSLPLLMNSRKIKTMSPEDMVIVMCFHGLKHAWQNLEWLADLIHTISNNPDIKWHDVVVRAENIGLKRIVLIGLFLAHKHGGIRYGSDIENMFASDASMQKLAGEIELDLFRSQTLGIEPFFYLKSRERFKDQGFFLFYYFTNRVLVYLRWIVRHITVIRTGPDIGVG
jgi:hypothetical protein